MRDQQLGIELALGNELQRFFAITAVHATGLEGQILAVHIGQRQDLRLVVKCHHEDLLRLLYHKFRPFSTV